MTSAWLPFVASSRAQAPAGVAAAAGDDRVQRVLTRSLVGPLATRGCRRLGGELLMERCQVQPGAFP